MVSFFFSFCFYLLAATCKQQGTSGARANAPVPCVQGVRDCRRAAALKHPRQSQATGATFLAAARNQANASVSGRQARQAGERSHRHPSISDSRTREVPNKSRGVRRNANYAGGGACVNHACHVIALECQQCGRWEEPVRHSNSACPCIAVGTSRKRSTMVSRCFRRRARVSSCA